MPEGPISEPPGDPTERAQSDEKDHAQGAPAVVPPEEPLDPEEISDLEAHGESPGEDPDFEEDLDHEDEPDLGAAADLDEAPGPIGDAENPEDGGGPS